MLSQRNWSRYAGRLTAAGAFSIIATMACAADMPRMMEAIMQRGVGGPDVLKLERVPVPQPGADQVLVHIYAVGINPLEWRARMGVQRQDQDRPASSEASGPPQPVIPGDEMAGVIAAVGPGAARWHVGDAVYGRTARMGAYAQYAVAKSDGITAKPKSLTFAEAAGIPIAGTTGFLAVKQSGVGPGQTVVIVGAAGGVGSAALQVAKTQGAKTIAIASSQHNAYLKQLGADEIVNYDKENPADKIKNADAVINMVDGPVPGELAYVKRGGAIILPAGVIPKEQCASAGVTCQGMARSNAPGAAALYDQINHLADAGQFTVKIEKAFPLAQAGQAQELDRGGHAEGKIVLITTAAANRH